MNRNSVHERMTLPRATIEQASIQIPFVRYLSHIIFVFADVILYNICKCKCYEVLLYGKTDHSNTEHPPHPATDG